MAKAVICDVVGCGISVALDDTNNIFDDEDIVDLLNELRDSETTVDFIRKMRSDLCPGHRSELIHCLWEAHTNFMAGK